MARSAFRESSDSESEPAYAVEENLSLSPNLGSYHLFHFFCSSAPGDRQEVGGESPPR